MAEVMVAIAVITIVGAVAIPMVSNIMLNSQAETAANNLEFLNQGVWKYQHAGAQVTNASGSTSNVVALLKTRDESMPGSPYVDATFSIRMSSSTNDYRGMWNGSTFELLSPGETGSGMNLLLMQSR